MQVIQGGTANLAVLGGNLPPSFGRETFESNDACPAHGERRAGRPMQWASGPFHQPFDYSFPARTGDGTRQRKTIVGQFTVAQK